MNVQIPEDFIRQITNVVRALAGIGLLATVAYSLTVTNLPLAHRLAAFVACGVIFVALAILLVVTEYVRRRAEAVPKVESRIDPAILRMMDAVTTRYAPNAAEPEETFHCELIKNRTTLYLKCAALIQEAKKEILDTTWGPRPPQIKPHEEAAQQAYIAARKSLPKDVDYLELFTLAEHNLSRFRDAARDSTRLDEYEVRIHPETINDYSLIDYLVIDRSVVVISLIDSKELRDVQYLMVRCRPLAELFRNWFFECWQNSDAI